MPQPLNTLRRRLLRRIRFVMLGVAAACSALWLHSKFQGVFITCMTDVLTSSEQTYCSHQRALQSSSGRLWIAYERAELLEEYSRHSKRLRWMTGIVRPAEFPFGDAPPDLRRFGIDWHWQQIDNSNAKERFVYRHLLVSIPYWLVVSITSFIAFILSIRPFREHRRMRKGLCPACGYDVRATPDHCPECGLGVASA